MLQKSGDCMLPVRNNAERSGVKQWDKLPTQLCVCVFSWSMVKVLTHECPSNILIEAWSIKVYRFHQAPRQLRKWQALIKASYSQWNVWGRNKLIIRCKCSMTSKCYEMLRSYYWVTSLILHAMSLHSEIQWNKICSFTSYQLTQTTDIAIDNVPCWMPNLEPAFRFKLSMRQSEWH